FFFFSSRRRHTRCLSDWSSDVCSSDLVTLAWTLFFTLWLSYEDYGNGYRALVAQMKARFPAGAGCVASRDLGEPQRAMLEYHGEIGRASCRERGLLAVDGVSSRQVNRA